MGKTTGSDRKYLRQLAHPLKPLVQIGSSGVTDALIAAVDTALRDHELIKIRFLEYTFVLMRNHVRLQLRHEIHDHNHYNQQRGAPKIERNVPF